jgi:hypothetical protein
MDASTARADRYGGQCGFSPFAPTARLPGASTSPPSFRNKPPILPGVPPSHRQLDHGDLQPTSRRLALDEAALRLVRREELDGRYRGLGHHEHLSRDGRVGTAGEAGAREPKRMSRCLAVNSTWLKALSGRVAAPTRAASPVRRTSALTSSTAAIMDVVCRIRTSELSRKGRLFPLSPYRHSRRCDRRQAKT